MKFLLLFSVFIFCVFFPLNTKVNAFLKIQPEEVFTFSELIASFGKVLVTHKVVTEDGYILALDRVMNPKDVGKHPLKKKPVIVFHGLFAQSSIFFVNSLDEAESGKGSKYGNNLGLALLEAGYDLWLPNARGNGRSNKHLNLTTYNSEFWEFSYDHIANYDVPAVVDYVLGVTGYATAAWVGYSQGGQTMLAKLTLTPDIADKIHPFIGLGTPTLADLGPAVKIFAYEPFRLFFELLPMPCLLGEPLTGFISQLLCRPEYVIFGENGTTGICKLIIDLSMGTNYNLNQKRIPVYMHYLLNRISNWQITHYFQTITKKKWTRFDYDSGHLLKGRNKKVYGSNEAPEFKLKNVKKSLKAVMFYGNQDILATKKQHDNLVKELSENGVNIKAVQVEGDWNHFDWIGGVGAGQKVYDLVINVLQENVKNDFKD